jgi:hypothetical protein
MEELKTKRGRRKRGGEQGKVKEERLQLKTKKKSNEDRECGNNIHDQSKRSQGGVREFG